MNEIISVLEKHYDNWAHEYYERYKNETYHPIEYYCGNTYRQINGYLRNYWNDFNLLADRDQSEEVRKLSAIIDAAPRVPFDLTVYRAVYPYCISELMSNQCYVEKGFLSTTLFLANIAEIDDLSGLRSILEICVKKGTRGVYVDSLEKYAPNFERSENELLLYHGYTLQLLSTPTLEGGYTIYKCQLV